MNERADKVSTAWWSPRVQQRVEIRRWGWKGQPVILFPTAGGDCEEVERFWMMKVLAPLLDAGRLKVYSVDSISGKAWIDRDRTAEDKASTQVAFDAFIAHELIPAIWADSGGERREVITTGASIGAWNALSVASRHPDLVRAAVCMSGTYDLRRWMGSTVTFDFHTCSPLNFVPSLPEDSEQLRLLRSRFFLMATGSGDYEAPWESWMVARVLGARAIPNRVDDWGPEWRHDWVTWREMLPKYLDQLCD